MNIQYVKDNTVWVVKHTWGRETLTGKELDKLTKVEVQAATLVWGHILILFLMNNIKGLSVIALYIFIVDTERSVIMASENVSIARGVKSKLPTSKIPGRINIVTDTGEMFVDDSSSLRVQIKDTTKISFTESQILTETQEAQARSNIGAVNADESEEVTTALISTNITNTSTNNELAGAKAVYDAISNNSLEWEPF